tara:strand:+ start:118927 stop:119724 length:798 start_codon:yes stop_codon:yes gene_type:complete
MLFSGINPYIKTLKSVEVITGVVLKNPNKLTYKKQTMKLRSIVIDDSPLQQLLITKLVKEHSSLTLSGTYTNPLEANQHLKNGNVDLMFLDIEMPLLTGFDLLESLVNPPQTILVSKSPDYALKAFEYNITHYLLKPISIESFNSAVKKAVHLYEIKNPKNEVGDYIFVKSNLKNMKVFLSDIKWIEALGDYIKIVTEKQNIIVLSTMKYYAKILPEARFLRIHKSFIANLEKVEKFNSKYVEIRGEVLPLSRNRKETLYKYIDA